MSRQVDKMIDVIEDFERMAQPPAHGPEFEAWLTMADALGLLRDNVDHDVSSSTLSVNGLTSMRSVPAAAITPPDIDDLMSWSGCDPSST
jgi:hypothetical protein